MADSFDSLVGDAVAHAAAHVGWDFSYQQNRRHTEDAPWAYDEGVLSLLNGVEDMLDMDTGGGERLCELQRRAELWPPRVSAIEAYVPNVEVARRKLSPIGVEVVQYDDHEHLPLGDGAFDLITNRHGQYSETEIARLLKPGAAFITQQVGSDMCAGLNRLLDAPQETSEAWDLSRAVAALEAKGMEVVEQQEFRGRDVFDDIGAIVWQLLVVPWQIPDFTLDLYRDRLYRLHESIRAKGPVDVGQHHFFIVARRTNG